MQIIIDHTPLVRAGWGRQSVHRSVKANLRKQRARPRMIFAVISALLNLLPVYALAAAQDGSFTGRALSGAASGATEDGKTPAPVNTTGCPAVPAASANTGSSDTVHPAASPTPPVDVSALGPLRVHAANRRYFADGCGRPVYLTGSHTHNSFKDGGRDASTLPFDYDGYLDLMADHNHNFMRMWSGWELSFFEPQPWQRTGPGTALDGDAKFDLTKLDEAYFERLRARVQAARDRNIYVSIMLFEGWLLRFVDDSAAGHPFNPANNINGINADADGDGKITEAHTLNNPKVTAIQEAYVKKVIDTVNDLDNVLYEIANESVFPQAVDWQYHMINYVKSYQAAKPKQHPVGMTSTGHSSPDDDLADLLESPADWISPGRPADFTYDYLDNPPAADGSKVIISDIDHLSNVLINPPWVWKSITRGLNPIFMDVYPPLDTLQPDDASFMRKTIGYARTLASAIDLASMTPQPDLASTGYVLANPGTEYLVYQPAAESFTVNLQDGRYQYAWFNPETGLVAESGSLTASAGNRVFNPPFTATAGAVLHLTAETAMPSPPGQMRR